MKVSSVAQHMIDRLQERNTWHHIINLAVTLSGVTLNPKHQELWLTAGVLVGTVLGVLTREHTKDAASDKPKPAIDAPAVQPGLQDPSG